MPITAVLLFVSQMICLRFQLIRMFLHFLGRHCFFLFSSHCYHFTPSYRIFNSLLYPLSIDAYFYYAFSFILFLMYFFFHFPLATNFFVINLLVFYSFFRSISIFFFLHPFFFYYFFFFFFLPFYLSCFFFCCFFFFRFLLRPFSQWDLTRLENLSKSQIALRSSFNLRRATTVNISILSQFLAFAFLAENSC